MKSYQGIAMPKIILSNLWGIFSAGVLARIYEMLKKQEKPV